VRVLCGELHLERSDLALRDHRVGARAGLDVVVHRVLQPARGARAATVPALFSAAATPAVARCSRAHAIAVIALCRLAVFPRASEPAEASSELVGDGGS
jgi:hypothetical protein